MGVEYMKQVKELLEKRTKDIASWLQVTERYDAGWLRWVRIERSVDEKLGMVKAPRIISVIIEEGLVSLSADNVGDRHTVGRPPGAVELAMQFLEAKLSVQELKIFAKFARPPKVHDLKCQPDPYRELDRGRKLFEYRKNDRGFEVGDVLDLQEFDPHLLETGDRMIGLDAGYTGARTRRLVTYVLRGPAFGVPEGYAVLSLGAMP